MAANVDPGRDVFTQQGPPDPLDAVAPAGTLAVRLGIDATAKLPAEHAGPWPGAVKMAETICQQVSSRWAEYGLGPEPKGAEFGGLTTFGPPYVVFRESTGRQTAVTLDKSSDRIRQMFAQIARRYDLLNHLLSLGIDRRWRRRTVRLTPPGNEAQWILDVCTGTADLALAYWRASGQAVRIVGADFCRPMLAIGRDKCRRSGADGRLDLVEADALRLPFGDNRFDIVCVAFGLRNVSDTDAGLREMVRVCRPGGQVAVLEFSTPTRWPLGALYGWYFRRVLPKVGQALARNRQEAYNYLPASVGQFPQGEAMLARMRAAGLAQPQFRPFTLGVCTLYIGCKPGKPGNA